ncbi:MAG: hypothetical protein JW986_08745 [Methanotrichaceae archaeon]|nr:hypothetical protein [Methanotrichaceae archaeon]
MISADLVEKSYEEMAKEIEELLAESKRLAEGASSAIERSDSYRSQSVDLHGLDSERAEGLWNEAEELRSLAREMMRQAVDARIRAADIQHCLDIHDTVQAAMDYSKKAWDGAVRAGRL